MPKKFRKSLKSMNSRQLEAVANRMLGKAGFFKKPENAVTLEAALNDPSLVDDYLAQNRESHLPADCISAAGHLRAPLQGKA